MSPLRVLMIAAAPLTLARVLFAGAPRESIARPKNNAAAHAAYDGSVAKAKLLVEELQCTACSEGDGECRSRLVPKLAFVPLGCHPVNPRGYGPRSC